MRGSYHRRCTLLARSARLRYRGRMSGRDGAKGFALLVSVAAGCSGSSGSGPIALADFHAAGMKAACHLNVFCGRSPDQATCLASAQEEPHFFVSLQALVAAGRIQYDGLKARTCLDEYDALTTCDRHVVNAPSFAAMCDEVLVGLVPEGGACFFDDECQNRGSCSGKTGCDDAFAECCAGTCTAGATVVPAGGDCSAPPANCEEGTTCVTSSGGLATCVPLAVTVGASCASIACASSLICDAQTKTCRLPSPEGGACTPGLNGLDCDDAHDFCDPTGHCTARLAIGAPCTRAAQACVGWAACDATTSTCVALPLVGQPCASGDSPLACLGGVRCDPTGICALLPVGASCL